MNELLATQKNKSDNKLKILIIGRINTFVTGGIHKSCHLLSTYMKMCGHTVISYDTSELLPNNLSCFDVAIIYTGDPERPDFKFVDNKIKFLQQKNIPVLVCLSYNLKRDRTRYIKNKIIEYNKGKSVPVLAFFFTESAALDPDLLTIHDYTCVIPKTIFIQDKLLLKTFDEREGICIGDVSKFQNENIFGGHPQLWIDAIRKYAPDINIYAYKQYQSENLLQHVQYIPYMDKNFGEFISKRKLFLSLTKHCTFEMVPCEAQSYGVPVIYRHMPQSLSELISITGFAVRTPEEAAYMVNWLTHDKESYETLSKSSIFNAKSKHIDLIISSIDGYIRLALHRISVLKNKINSHN